MNLTFEEVHNKNLEEKFELEFVKLNTSQKEAVAQIEGPVLVLAGPGTGKTQILSARIANILLQTDVLPENILCLTYTDAGTIAMRKRLFRFIGADAYRVGIFTFHAFCNSVIQENLHLFGLRNLDAVSEIEQISLVHEIIDKFSSDNILKRHTGEVYFETKRLLNLYEAMKKEGWTPEFILQKKEEYLNDLPNRDEFIYKRDSKYGKKGELKKAAIEEEQNRMQQLEAAVKTFEQYEQKLKLNNVYDFSDMINWVIETFKKNENLLASYREKFQYVLVDEFQDTSGTQINLLHQLIDYWESPNVFVVGDDDQSIYRFQGANVENIIDFSSRYSSSLKTIMLTENYRSSQKILDAAKTLIDKNDSEKRISNNKTLTASNNDFASIDLIPELRSYYNPAHEVVDIAKEIVQLNQSGTAWNEIAVIYRNHDQANDIIRYLQTKNIPVNAKKRINIFEEILIRKLINILQFIDAEKTKTDSGEPFLFEMLHYNEFQITPSEIANISYQLNLRSQGKSRAEQTWRGMLGSAKTTNQHDLFSSKKTLTAIEKFSRVIEELISDSANFTLQELIENILTKCGLLANALTSNEKSWNLELLTTFFDFVKNECSKNPKTNLHFILELILLMQDNGVQLPAEKITYSENGVNFITAHSSKGLEFENVFIIGCIKDKWDKARANNNFKLPDNLFEETGDEIEESRRLFYVAMTRAKKQLVISFSERDNNSKELEKSQFVAELEEGGKVLLKQIQLANEELIDFKLKILQLTETEIANDELISKEFLDSLLQNYTLSVTHLNNFLRCPVSFYFENLLRVPAPKSASMTFGSAVHYALECLFKNMNIHPEKLFGTVEDFIKDFKWYMNRHSDAFTSIQFQNRMDYASQILPLYYNKYLSEWNKITSIERTYRNVVVDGVPLNGKLDKLEFDGVYVNVVDYKTGQFKNAQKKLNRPNKEKVEKAISQNKKPNTIDQIGGDYWRQAVFYKILMDNDQTKNWKMHSTEFDFIEPDKESKEFIKSKIEITDEDVKVVQQQIKTSFTSILKKELTKGCNEPDCRWCNFVKDFYARNSLKS